MIYLLTMQQYNINGKPFVLRRQDLDITVLPTKYVTELRSIPNAKLSRGKANFMVINMSLYTTTLATADLVVLDRNGVTNGP